MVRETGEEGKRRREVVWITAGASASALSSVVHSPNALGDVSCQNAYKIQLRARRTDDENEKGRNARGDILATCAVTVTSRIHPVKCTAVARRGEPLSKAVHVVMES